MNPSLGIVVPHFNQHETLQGSLKSIAKSEVEKRIVVVDDGSLPGSIYAPQNTSLIQLIPNQGVQFARNIGFYFLNRFKCKYTLFSDSDVIWARGALDKLIEALESYGGASYAYCDFLWGDKKLTSGSFDADKLRSTNYISTMSVIRTEVLNNYGMNPFDESLERLQDWDLWLRLLERGCVGRYVPEMLFSTEFSENGISAAPGYQEAVNAVNAKHKSSR